MKRSYSHSHPYGTVHRVSRRLLSSLLIKPALYLASVTLLGLSACDSKSTTPLEPIEPNLGTTPITTPYYLASLVREQKVTVVGLERSALSHPNPSSKPERTTLSVLFEGTRIEGRTNAEFQRLADSVGDGHNTKPLDYADRPRMCLSSASGISLTSTHGYNAKHPAGSSLNDIVQVSYSTYKYRLVEQTPPAEYSNPLYIAPVIKLKPLEQALPLEKIAIFSDFPASNPPNGKWLHEAFHITLTEAPDQPAQTMKLTVILSNGQVLEHDFSVVIKELK